MSKPTRFASKNHRPRRLRRLVTLLFLLLALPAHAQEQAKKLVALLDYLGSDYKNAVKDGQVLSKDEYEEMQEFSKRGLELFSQLKAIDKGDKAGIEATVKSLATQVAQKADPKSVAELAQSAKDKLIAAYKIVPYPKQLPSWDAGKRLYLENCAQCHGENGKGDGPGVSSMNPKTPLPANFTDPERMAGLSPFKGFNTASFGIEGTAMASFAALSEEQRWQVSFYVMSLRFTREQTAAGEALLAAKKLPMDLTSVATLATSSDEQLEEKLKSYLGQETQVNDGLAFLRRGLLEKKPTDPLIVTRNLIREAAELYAGGQKEKAYQKAVDAYLDGFELAEPALFAKDAAFGRGLEGLFTQFRTAIKQGVAPEEIQKRHDEIIGKLDQAGEMLARTDEYSGIYFFINSALIILREGLEATLVLAAILAMLKVMGATDAVRYIHLGWILALIAGGLTWLATQSFLTLSGQNRESMEGFISVFAAVALFYVGYWLHTKSEANKWQSFIHDKVQNVVDAKEFSVWWGSHFSPYIVRLSKLYCFIKRSGFRTTTGHPQILSGFVAGLAVLGSADLRDLEARPEGSAEILSSASPARCSTSSRSFSPATASRNCKPPSWVLDNAGQFSAASAAVGHLSDAGKPWRPRPHAFRFYCHLFLAWRNERKRTP